MKNDETNIVKIETSPIVIDFLSLHRASLEAESIAEKITVDSDEENEMALSALKKIKQYSNECESSRKEAVKAPNEWVKRVNGMFAPINESFSMAERKIKSLMSAWLSKKEAIRKEEERRLQEKHDKAVERAQKKAEKAGVDFIPPPPPPVLMPETSIKSGNATAFTTQTWKAEVVDLLSLVKAVAEGKAPIDTLSPNDSFLNKQAKAYKKDGVYPGVRFFSVDDLRIR